VDSRGRGRREQRAPDVRHVDQQDGRGPGHSGVSAFSPSSRPSCQPTARAANDNAALPAERGQVDRGGRTASGTGRSFPCAAGERHGGRGFPRPPVGSDRRWWVRSGGRLAAEPTPGPTNAMNPIPARISPAGPGPTPTGGGRSGPGCVPGSWPRPGRADRVTSSIPASRLLNRDVSRSARQPALGQGLLANEPAMLKCRRSGCSASPGWTRRTPTPTGRSEGHDAPTRRTNCCSRRLL